MPNVYQILQWNEHFENSRSREIEHPAFVLMPNKQHGMGFQRIILAGADPLEGAATFGLWTMILQACSRQPSNAEVKRDGWLTDDGQPDGQPWDAEDLALRWRLPVAFVQRALDLFCNPKVGWMACRSSADQLPTKKQPAADNVPDKAKPDAIQVRKKGGDPEGKGRKRKPVAEPVAVEPEVPPPASTEGNTVSDAPAINCQPTADQLPTEQNRTEQNRSTASPPSPVAAPPDSTATTTAPKPPADPAKLTLTDLMTKRVLGIDPAEVIKAIQTGSAIAVARAFRAITSNDRIPEWERDTDGLQIGIVVVILAWKRWMRQPIREASGFRNARAAWADLQEKTRAQLKRDLVGPYQQALDAIEGAPPVAGVGGPPAAGVA